MPFRQVSVALLESSWSFEERYAFSEAVEERDGDSGVVAGDITPRGLDARRMVHREAVAADERVVPEEADVALVGAVDGVALRAGPDAIGLALPDPTAVVGNTLGGTETPSA